MRYANINTQETTDALSNTLVLPDRIISGAGIEQWSRLGWREIVQIDEPTVGYRVGEYLAVELTPLTCKMTVKTQINIAEEQAAQAAELAAALARQLAEAKALAKSLYPGPGDIRNVSPEAVARLLLAECTVIYTWLFAAAASGGHVPSKTAQQVTNELYAAIDSQT